MAKFAELIVPFSSDVKQSPQSVEQRTAPQTAPLTKGGLDRRIESYSKHSNVQLFGVEYDVQLFGDGLDLATRLFEVRCHDGVEPLLKIAAR